MVYCLGSAQENKGKITQGLGMQPLPKHSPELSVTLSPLLPLDADTQHCPSLNPWPAGDS